MNIFQNRDNLFGCLYSEVVSDSLLSLFRLAKQIQLRLGKQGYLLDNYLTHFLRAWAANWLLWPRMRVTIPALSFSSYWIPRPRTRGCRM